MVNLFKVYRSITDSRFRQYIAQKMNEYDEVINLSEDLLMTFFKNKYEMFLKSGKWKAPDEDQEKVLASRCRLKI